MTRTPENRPVSGQKSRTDRIREIRSKGRPELTFERVRQLLDYDPYNGIFRHRISRGGKKAGTVAGTACSGYNALFIDCFQYRSGRIAWLLMTGKPVPAGKLIDHKNGQRNDDRWENLRLATPAENARNRGFCKRNTSGKVGVHRIKSGNKWGADIGLDGRNIHLGRFDTLDEAIAARCKAERVHYGEFVRPMTEASANG